MTLLVASGIYFLVGLFGLYMLCAICPGGLRSNWNAKLFKEEWALIVAIVLFWPIFWLLAFLLREE